MSVKEREKYFEERRQQRLQAERTSVSFDKSEKYRCEQMVICKINNVPTNNAQTKRDFIVSKAANSLGNLFVKVKIADNIINVTPQTYQEAVMVVAELDNIKCNDVVVNVNSETGAITKVINHSDIIQKWEQHKKKLEKSYHIVPESGKKAIEDFIKWRKNKYVLKQIS
jgi:hypothetical protein